MRYYSSTFVSTTIVGDISSTQTQITLQGVNGAPANTPWTAVLDGDTDNAELVDVTGVAGNVLTVVRGVAGTVAIGHKNGATFNHDTSHRDYQEPQDHIAANSAVHGITGTVVGTSDAQTLTNKTLDGASNTFTNVPESAVTGLSSGLAAKLDKPATAWAKGSLLVGTGVGTYDTLPPGTTGDTLTVQSDGSIAFTPGTDSVWQDYNPVLSGSSGGTIAVGNGSLTGRYIQIGKTVTASVRWQTGSTSSASGVSGSAQVSLPVAPASTALTFGQMVGLTQTITANTPQGATILPGDSQATLYELVAGAGNVGVATEVIPASGLTTQPGSNFSNRGNWLLTITYEAA